jgi:metal-responsive CopG/Arc/MetJ family transcriptional regulator
MVPVMAKAKPEPDTEQITIRVTKKLITHLERLGERFGIKRSQLIHRAIEEYVERRQGDLMPEPKPPRR